MYSSMRTDSISSPHILVRTHTHTLLFHIQPHKDTLTLSSLSHRTRSTRWIQHTTCQDMLWPSILIFWPWREAGLVVMLTRRWSEYTRPKEPRAPIKDRNESDDTDEWRDHHQMTDAYQGKWSKTREYRKKQVPKEILIGFICDTGGLVRFISTFTFLSCTNSEFVGLVDSISTVNNMSLTLLVLRVVVRVVLVCVVVIVP